MKYKVGDVVRIISDEKLDEMEKEGIGVYPMGHMIAGLKVEIIEAKDEFYRFNVSSHFMFSEHVIEGLAEPFNIKELKESYEKLKTFKIGTENYFDCPQGYQFVDENGNVINATKIVLEKKKKKEYPKTYKECLSVLDCCSYNVGFDRCETSYEENLHNKILALRKLYICRNAYWKIAGEEMGLGKSWSPNWHDDEKKYTIECYEGEIIKDFSLRENRVLVFPTVKMRDTFKKNFDPDIEICKELL